MRSDELVAIPLSSPPTIAMCGRGLHHPEQHGRYYLPEHWCLHLYRWRGRVLVGGDQVTVRPGLWHCCPPRQQLDYHYGPESRHLVTHFRLPDEGPMRRIRHAHPPAGGQARLTALFEAAVDAWPGEPTRSTALIWALLWELSQPAVAAGRVDARVQEACRHIEAHLAETISVADLARRLDCSHNQLTRLFRQQLGRTVVAHVRHRRVRRAQHLLSATTMPVAAVGAAVGMADAQAFNKAFRAVVGCAPSTWRRQGAAARIEQDAETSGGVSPSGPGTGRPRR